MLVDVEECIGTEQRLAERCERAIFWGRGHGDGTGVLGGFGFRCWGRCKSCGLLF